MSTARSALCEAVLHHVQEGLVNPRIISQFGVECHPQEIALAALGRTDFFQKAAFQGGTCLRIFHSLNRFSEDLDFALQSPGSLFAIKPYLDALARELAAYGYDLEMDGRSKRTLVANPSTRFAW